jgi:polar amino acid transport system substrate-binding protein
VKARHHVILTAAAVSIALALSGCGSSQGSSKVAADCTPAVPGVKTVGEGKLSIAVAEYPPYVSMKGGSLSGVDGTVLTEVAKALCLDVSAQTMSFPAIVESVKRGRADLSAGNWYINEERAQSFELSEPVYVDQMALMSAEGAKTLDELQGKSVGTTQGYLWVGDLQKQLGKDNVRLYASEDAVYQDVKAGRIAAGVITYGGGAYLLKSNSDTKFKVEIFAPDPRIPASVGARTAVLINKGNTDLQKAVNQVVEEMRKNGELAKALERAGIDKSAADVSGK